MRFLTKLMPVAALGAALALAAPATPGQAAEPLAGVTPANGYWYDPPPRWVPGPPRRWRGPPPGYGYYAPPPRAYYPPPRVYYPPPRYYAPPPPRPGVGLYFRF